MLRRASHAIDTQRDRLQRWIDGLPAWQRPPIYGALFIILLMGLRGLLIFLPILVIGFFFAGGSLADVLRILGILALALCGGFLSGVSYSLFGRWLRPIPLAGPYLAGIVTVLPYMAVLVIIMHIGDQKPLQWPPESDYTFTFVVVSLFFGPLIGHLMFRSQPESSRSGSRRT